MHTLYKIAQQFWQLWPNCTTCMQIARGSHITKTHVAWHSAPTLYLFLSLSQTFLHWLADIRHETHIYVCVCRLTLQCWFHVCYDVRGLAALLRIDTYDITISGFNLNLWPLLNVLEECSLIPYLYILCILACVCEFFFCISLYIFIENTLQWIGGSSNSFVCNLVDHVSDQVKKQFKNLEEVAEGDAQP